MAQYFFDISTGAGSEDRIQRDIRDPLDLRIRALAEAADIAVRESQRGRETEVVVTVRDLGGAVCLRVRLLSQVDVP